MPAIYDTQSYSIHIVGCYIHVVYIHTHIVPYCIYTYIHSYILYEHICYIHIIRMYTLTAVERMSDIIIGPLCDKLVRGGHREYIEVVL